MIPSQDTGVKTTEYKVSAVFLENKKNKLEFSLIIGSWISSIHYRVRYILSINMAGVR